MCKNKREAGDFLCRMPRPGGRGEAEQPPNATVGRAGVPSAQWPDIPRHPCPHASGPHLDRGGHPQAPVSSHLWAVPDRGGHSAGPAASCHSAGDASCQASAPTSLRGLGQANTRPKAPKAKASCPGSPGEWRDRQEMSNVARCSGCHGNSLKVQ